MKLNRKVKTLIAAQQRYKCANLNRPIVGLDEFKCPLWDKSSAANTNPTVLHAIGSFDESGYKVCHIFGKNVDYDTLRRKDGMFVALCRACYHAKSAYHAANSWEDSEEMRGFASDFNRAVQLNNVSELRQVMSSAFFDETFDCKPAFELARSNNLTGICELFLERGVINYNAGSYALVEACTAGQTDIVRILLSSTIHFGSLGSFMLLLRPVCINGHVDVLKLLLSDRRCTIGFNDVVDVANIFVSTAAKGRSNIIEILLNPSNIGVSRLFGNPSNITKPNTIHFDKALGVAFENANGDMWSEHWAVVQILMKQYFVKNLQIPYTPIYEQILEKSIKLYDIELFELYLTNALHEYGFWSSDKIFNQVCTNLWHLGAKLMLKDKRANAGWFYSALLKVCDSTSIATGIFVIDLLSIAPIDLSFRNYEAFDLACKTGNPNTVYALLDCMKTAKQILRPIKLNHIEHACDTGNDKLLTALLSYPSALCGPIDAETVRRLLNVASDKKYSKVHDVLTKYAITSFGTDPS